MKEGERFYKLGKKEGTPEVVVFAIVEGDKIIVEKRRNNSKYAAGEVIIPGGKVEIGEDLYDAVRREMKEETGIEESEQTWLVSSCFEDESGSLMHLFMIKTEEEVRNIEGFFYRVKMDDLYDSTNWSSVKMFIEVIRNNLGVESGYEKRDREKRAN